MYLRVVCFLHAALLFIIVPDFKLYATYSLFHSMHLERVRIGRMTPPSRKERIPRRNLPLSPWYYPGGDLPLSLQSGIIADSDLNDRGGSEHHSITTFLASFGTRKCPIKLGYRPSDSVDFLLRSSLSISPCTGIKARDDVNPWLA
jgi:hypothetical protein